MIKLKVLHKKPDEIMSIVRELRSQGYWQGKDFDFSYHQAQYDNDGWNAVEPRHTMFTFYNEKLSTYFALKWL